MKKIKLFLEFVSGSKKSLFIPLTYDHISKILKCSLDDVDDFERWLEENIKPGEIFHGSISSGNSKEIPIFDEIKSEDDYKEMWNQFNSDRTESNAHNYDGL